MAIEKYVSAAFRCHDIGDPSAVKIARVGSVYVPPRLAEVAAKIAAAPDPRFCYVHAIAMTDGDAYGSNLNGDIFTSDQLTGVQTTSESAKNPGAFKDICVPRYKTFEMAKFFRNHANGPEDPSYGDVAFADWNEQMKRVELLIRIARQAIPAMGMQSGADIVVKLDRRGYLTLSMGTTIDYEKCRYCGAENQFMPQRCTHLANRMNEIMPDGRQISAENFGVRFFDISDVSIPADPSAYSLAKVASAVGVANRALDARGEIISWRKGAEIEKHVPIGEPVAATAAPAVTTDEAPEAYSPDELRDMLDAAGGSQSDVLSTLAASGVVLSPVELALLTATAEPEKQAFVGFGSLGLDKFNAAVYAIARPKFASRSGFVALPLTSGWESSKLAEQGHTVMADYYGHYRDALRSLPQSTFLKMAHRNPLIREQAMAGDVQGALAYLNHTGILSNR